MKRSCAATGMTRMICACASSSVLSRTNRLDAELSIVRTSNPSATAGKWDDAMNQSPAGVRLLAEGEAWRSHFEAAAPMFLALETAFPADHAIGTRTASAYRSLGTIDPKFTDTAIAVEEKLSAGQPSRSSKPHRHWRDGSRPRSLR